MGNMNSRKLPSQDYILRMENSASDFPRYEEIIKGMVKEEKKMKLVKNDLEVNFKKKNQLF